jgi:hypothetical protein
LKHQSSAAARSAGDGHSAAQLARVASETHAGAAGSPPGLDHDGIADLARGTRPIRVRPERARRRVPYADAREAARQGSLVGGPPDRVRAGAEKPCRLPLSPRGQALEAAICFRRDEPHGIGRRHQSVEQRLSRLAGGRQRDDFYGGRHRMGKARICGRDNLMAANRREIGNQCSQHCGRLSAQ